MLWNGTTWERAKSPGIPAPVVGLASLARTANAFSPSQTNPGYRAIAITMVLTTAADVPVQIGLYSNWGAGGNSTRIAASSYTSTPGVHTLLVSPDELAAQNTFAPDGGMEIAVDRVTCPRVFTLGLVFQGTPTQPATASLQFHFLP
jgi:hypothetical protein